MKERRIALRTVVMAGALILGFEMTARTDSATAARREPAAAVSHQPRNTEASTKQTPGRTPPYYDNVEDVKIPETLSPATFDDPTTRQAYQVAQDKPKLLLQVPCYCPCDSPEIGHKSLLDCFVDAHAAECGICKSEAITAARLQKEGVSVQDIRDKLAANYSKAH